MEFARQRLFTVKEDLPTFAEWNGVEVEFFSRCSRVGDSNDLDFCDVYRRFDLFRGGFEI